MLSDAEERRLAQIESLLRADDPRFVRRFDVEPRRRRLRTLAWVGLAVSLAVVVTGLVAGSVPCAVLGLIAGAGSVGWWATHRLERPHRR
jgi:Protein of unknown function (DUF3040)